MHSPPRQPAPPAPPEQPAPAIAAEAAPPPPPSAEPAADLGPELPADVGAFDLTKDDATLTTTKPFQPPSEGFRLFGREEGVPKASAEQQVRGAISAGNAPPSEAEEDREVEDYVNWYYRQ